MQACRKFIVKGRVQGVWFRESTRRKALPLGLTGHAINRSDGSVEVLVCGEVAAIETLQSWLSKGPRLARVDSVVANDLVVDVPEGFTTA